MQPQKEPLAVVTMVYNEPDMLPIWLKYYSSQVGQQNCYVLDHGSNDGSTDGIGANIMRFPRSPFSENLRTLSCNQFCNALFFYYNRVLFCDSDEIVVVDPDLSPNLLEYAKRTDLPEVVTLLGMDVLHDEAKEGKLDTSLPILGQRSLARANSSLCKPNFIARSVSWHDGFHGCNDPPVFADLYHFHLAYCDFELIERRQEKRNSVKFHGKGGGHHSILPNAMVDHIRREYLPLTQVDTELRPGDAARDAFIARMMDPPAMRGPYHDLRPTIADELWRIPPRFQAAF